ncbi:MAG: SAVED domain-containing protein [Denitromonas halophila]|nr:MAG: SAVED domain-containing protein [Denitromonas halophila]
MKRLVAKGLLQCLELPPQIFRDAHVADPSWQYSQVRSKPAVDTLIATRDGLLGRTAGRGPAITEKTAQKVWADAGGRCMFAGCGEDLTEIPLWTQTARIGYLAHIIASDPQGPRGSQQDSHRLANNPENIMLMCDAHHRLIDSFAPDDYKPDILDEMRRTHRDMVRNYLDSLAFPRMRAATLHANLAHVPTYFHDSELIDAILATGCAMLPGVIHYVRRKSPRDDRNTPGFWSQYLREHEGDIRQLVTGFNAASGATTENLAVFPLHHIPTIVLAGRIMGEAQAIRVFQYSRSRRTWAWNPGATPKPVGTFSVSTLPQARASEVLITIELSAAIDEEAMPPLLQPDLGAGRLPWLRIVTPNPDSDCISHPDDLDQFMQVARRAISHVQDVMRVRKVHLIAISPASTVFGFGQMLQPGHHPEYVLYDRAGREYPFVPAFSITGHDVSALDSERPVSISLR